MELIGDNLAAGRRITRLRAGLCLAGVVVLGLLNAEPVAADHLEGKQQATGAPEHRLSGIDVSKTSIAEVIKIYGEPTTRRDVLAQSVKDGVGGERNYIWEKAGMRLEVWTGYNNDHESEVYSVDVWGTEPRAEFGRSGRGLTLGSTLEEQRAIYGNRFFVSSTYGKTPPSRPDPKARMKSILLEWQDGKQMVIDYDLNGRVSHMQLSAPE